MPALRNISEGIRPGGMFMFTETFVKAIEPGPPHFKPRTRALYAEALGECGLRFVQPDELRVGRMPVFSQYVKFKNSTHFVRGID